MKNLSLRSIFESLMNEVNDVEALEIMKERKCE